MRKLLNYKEELKSQLGDTMPISLRVFAEAAKDAGISTSGTTKELFDLMEKGLVPAQKIMPFVSKGFIKFANNNDALTIAMTKLNKRYDIAKDSLLDFNEAAFGRGVESGISFLLNGFNDLMKSSKLLATILGGVFKGAVVGLTAPFRLLYAAIFDITKLLGLHDAKGFDLDLIAVTSTVLGLIPALWALWKVMGAIGGVMGIMGGGVVMTAVGGLTTAVTSLTALLVAATAGYAVGSLISNKIQEESPDTNVDIGRSIASVLAIFGNEQASKSLVSEASVGGFTPNYQPDSNFIRKMLLPEVNTAQQQFNTQPQKVDVSITLNESMLDAKITDGANNQVSSFANGAYN